MDRRVFSRSGLGIFAGLFATSAKAADKPTHRLALQISVEERRAQQVAL